MVQSLIDETRNVVDLVGNRWMYKKVREHYLTTDRLRRSIELGNLVAPPHASSAMRFLDMWVIAMVI